MVNQETLAIKDTQMVCELSLDPVGPVVFVQADQGFSSGKGEVTTLHTSFPDELNVRLTWCAVAPSHLEGRDSSGV